MLVYIIVLNDMNEVISILCRDGVTRERIRKKKNAISKAK